MDPKLITFEGIDYCGKTTQIRRLETYLRERDIPIFVGIEPGSTSLGGAFRRILKEPKKAYEALNDKFRGEADFPELDVEQERTNESELLMFIASRAEYVHHVIKPKLREGFSVLSDRYLDSTVAYQGGGRWQSDRDKLAIIHKLNLLATQGIMPDLTFLLSIDYQTLLKRSEGKRKDKIESSGSRFYNGVILEYASLAERNQKRIVKIDGKQDPDTIAKKILTKVNELYGI